MVDQAALRRAMLEHLRVPLAEDALEDVLARLVAQACAVLGTDHAAGVLAPEEDGPRLVVGSSPLVADLEQQPLPGERGPCVVTAEHGDTVEIDDLATAHDTGAGYRAAALAHGFRALLTVPLPIADVPVSALCLYHEEVRAWTREDVAAAGELAGLAAARIRDLRTLRGARELNAQLTTALESRVAIEQAKGVLAAQQGITTDAAFELLRRRARAAQRPLHDLAREVVDRGTGHGRGAGG